MTNIKTSERVWFEVLTAIPIGDGAILPPGGYAGERRRIGPVLQGRKTWADPEFYVEFTAAQLRKMGAKLENSSTTHGGANLTAHVNSGKVRVIG